MARKRSARQKAILRRRIFFAGCIAVLLLIVVAVMAGVKMLTGNKDKPSSGAGTVSETAQVSSQKPTVSDESSPEQSSVPSEAQTVAKTPDGLDPDFSKLLLVNGEHPLPENYDYKGNLTTIPDSYINGSLKQIDKDVWPYMKAMLDAARKDGVNLAVWSPFRDYATQKMLFQKQVDRQKAADPTLTDEQAEIKAATVVARPGTSEHHTGLAADFNMADDKFETTPMYTWMKEHAEEYGFIMRYSKEKQPVTGVIHESWHWRFVGINVAKEINRSGLCLEEYLEQRN